MNNDSDTASQLILPKDDSLAIGWTFAIKLVLIVFGAESFQILANQRINDLHHSLQLWNRWDSLHYLKLAEFGYSSGDPMKAWLYPLFPWTPEIAPRLAQDQVLTRSKT